MPDYDDFIEVAKWMRDNAPKIKLKEKDIISYRNVDGYQLYTIEEVSIILKTKTDYIYKLIESHYLKALCQDVFSKIDKNRYLISHNNLIKYLDSDGKGV